MNLFFVLFAAPNAGHPGPNETIFPNPMVEVGGVSNIFIVKIKTRYSLIKLNMSNITYMHIYLCL